MITTTVLPYLVSPLKLTNNIDWVGGGDARAKGWFCIRAKTWSLTFSLNSFNL